MWANPVKLPLNYATIYDVPTLIAAILSREMNGQFLSFSGMMVLFTKYLNVGLPLKHLHPYHRSKTRKSLILLQPPNDENILLESYVT